MRRRRDLRFAASLGQFGLLGGVLRHDHHSHGRARHLERRCEQVWHGQGRLDHSSVHARRGATRQGLPINPEVFDGNTAETKTLLPILKKVMKRFSNLRFWWLTVVC